MGPHLEKIVAPLLQRPEDRRLIEAAYYRGQLRLERKEPKEALKDFDLVVKENPSFRPAYLSRAQLHFQRGDDVHGLADITTFLNLGSAKPFTPRDPRLFAQRGRLLLQLVPKWGLPPAEGRPNPSWREMKSTRPPGWATAAPSCSTTWDRWRSG
jgi:hypothetical protein